MFAKFVFLAFVLAVSAGSAIKRSDTVAAPTSVDYNSQEYYNQYYKYLAQQEAQQQYRQEGTFLETAKTTIQGFITPLLTIDNAILAFALAGFIVVLQFVGIINIGELIDGVNSLFDSRSFRVARSFLGEDLDQLADIVHNAIENVEKWKDL